MRESKVKLMLPAAVAGHEETPASDAEMLFYTHIFFTYTSLSASSAQKLQGNASCVEINTSGVSFCLSSIMLQQR